MDEKFTHTDTDTHTDKDQLFLQEVIDGNVTITHRIDNIKTKRITGKLSIKTIDYGDLRHIQVDTINIESIGIEELNNLPSTLKILDCSQNKITSLDNLPSSLKTLYCYGNQITSLDNLPSSLKTLYCADNKITKLDNLPNLNGIGYSQTPIHNLVEKYDTDGDNLNLAFLIKSLQLDSNIHTEADIHPILDLIPPDEYKSLSDLLSDLNINLKTHSSEEILNTLKHLV